MKINNVCRINHNLFLISLILLMSLWQLFVKSPSVFALEDEDTITFSDLGSSQIILHGPYETGGFRFNLPAQWTFQDGIQARLVISAFSTRDDATDQNNVKDGGFLGAMLDVFVNGKLQQSIPLQSGSDNSYIVPINLSNLKSPRPDGTLDISFFLNASIDCNYDFHYTTIVISDQSAFELPHIENSIPLDLRALPWPLYQSGLSIEKKSGIVVVPTSPSEDELKAALITISTFGRLTNKGYPLEIITASQFTNQMAVESDIIFVGKARNLPILKQFNLPIPVEEINFSNSQVQLDDGVLQLIPSIWSNQNVVLIVGGNTDVGVVKAAQALSAGNLQTGIHPNTSIIAEVRPIPVSTPNITDTALLGSSIISFSDIGYSTETITGIGLNWFLYEFNIPLGQEPTEAPLINLVYNNSALVDEERSGFVVYMNSELIGSAKFPDESKGINSVQIQIPLSSLKPGRNQIDIAATLIPRDVCSTAFFNGLWMSVFPESTIQMPLKPSSITEAPAHKLNSYPYPFINDPSLATTVFVVPEKDINSWSVASSIAYDLGQRATGTILAFDVAFNSSAVATFDENYNLIFVGKPQNLPIIYELKDSLPAYYEKNTNIAVLEDQQITYRISPDKDLGYLQLFSPPWNENVTALAILGTTSLGVTYAGQAITDASIRGRLVGDFATLDGTQEIVVDSQSGLGTGLLIPNLGPAVTIATQEAITPNQEVDTNATKRAILPALIAVIVLMVIVIVLAIVLRQKNTNSNS